VKLKLYSHPDDWRVEFDLGMQFGSMGKLHRAEKHFTKAIELAPREPYPHYELAYTFTLLKEYQNALRHYIITNDISPAFLQAQTEEFLCRQVIGKALEHETILLIREIQYRIEKQEFIGEEALELALSLVQSAPDCPISYFYLAIAVGDNDREAHESALRRCLALNPDDTTAIYASARLICLLRNNGRLHEAKVLCQMTQKIFPDNIHLKNLCDYFSDNEPECASDFQLPVTQHAGNFRTYADQFLR
jgi:tetratricopeptide (TPR) repeat protein